MDKQAMIIHNDQHFSINAMMDKTNQRIWVADYKFNDALAFTHFLNAKAKHFAAQKIIIPAKQEDVVALEKQGFILEGAAEGYLNGAPVNFMVAYPEPQRALSQHLSTKLEALDKILSLPVKSPKVIPPGYVIREATDQDAPALAALYGKVFTTYPTPLNQPDYVLSSMDNNVLFYVVTYDGKIACAAAAEMDLINSNAEMTNCATDPKHQGLGLMSIAMAELDRDVVQRGIKCLYSLSRSSEFAINLILHRLGYNYRGTLINNCHICGDWEDMHLWVKHKSYIS